jgi:azobenzene reductase
VIVVECDIIGGSVTLRVLAIAGSMREPSHTYSLIHTVSEALRERDAVVDVWNVRHPQLPLSKAEFRKASQYDEPDVRELGERVEAADAFVWGSPIYHNSFTGALKNLLDILHIGYFDMKTVGLLSHGGHRTSQAVDQLRIVARGVGALVIPKQVSTQKEDYEEDSSALGGYVITEQLIKDRIELFADQFVAVANATRSLHT